VPRKFATGRDYGDLDGWHFAGSERVRAFNWPAFAIHSFDGLRVGSTPIEDCP
jgi:hypothetical protein